MIGPLWITYAWADNEERDFDYLVGALTKAGVDSLYDRIALVVGRRLWAQIGANITSGTLLGWAYLITPRSLASQPCREELEYALSMALQAKGGDFPLIGLLSEGAIKDVPPALKVRLCVDLRSPDWAEQVRAGLQNKPMTRRVEETANYKIRVHDKYLGNPGLRAVEFLPRFGELRHWRIAYPKYGTQPTLIGTGPAGGGGAGAVLQMVAKGNVTIGGVDMEFIGSGDALTPGTSVYAVFEQKFPPQVAFGWANDAGGIPAVWYPTTLVSAGMGVASPRESSP
jgi:hypothetical protein